MIPRPELVMRASTLHNHHRSRWSIYSEPLGVPYSYVIEGRGYRVSGHASTLDEARTKVSDYYQRSAIPS